MLQFIFGRPSTGKSYSIINMIGERAEKGLKSVLIIPEQYSFESERAVLSHLGDKNFQNVEIASFSRLCESVGRCVGGIAGVTLSDADKVIFMNSALISVENELRLWRKYCRSVTFARTMLDTVGEFKINSVSAKELFSAAEKANGTTLKNKLFDIATIYSAYDIAVGEKFIDPADNLTKLYRQLDKFDYFKGKDVFFDGFKGFTGQQFKIIGRVLSQADNVVIALTGSENAKEYDIFSNIRKAAEKIERIAKRFDIEVGKPIYLNRSAIKYDGLKSVEKILSGEPSERTKKDGSVTICIASTLFDEADFAVRNIRRLVRTKEYRFRDFVIISRDLERYSQAVEYSCRKNSVPCFFDRREPLSAFPLSVAGKNAVKAAIKPTTENILNFHKTGMGVLDTDEISLLENYATVWNITGEMWQNEWIMDPRGFVSDQTPPDSAQLEKINNLRIKAFSPLEEFSKEFSGSAKKRAAALFNLFDSCCVGEKLADLAGKMTEIGGRFSYDNLKQSYEKYMKVLDSLARCFGERTVSSKEFLDALSVSVSSETVGVLPSMLDEVTFGAADRIRPSRPKIAFILGANQGIFPKNISSSGVLNVNERKNLIDLGIEIPDNSISSVIDENFLVYTNLCCASEKLFICFCESELSGEPLEPSAFLNEIKENVDCDIVFEFSNRLNEDNLPETFDGAYDLFCRTFNRPGSGNGELKTALIGSPEENKINLIENETNNNVKVLSQKNAEALYGKNIVMSATRFDNFHRCPFSFFCKYGLNAKRLQPAQFDVLQRGTIVHYALERLIKENKETVSTLSNAEVCELIDRYVKNYLDSVTGYRYIETERSVFLVERITRALKEVACHIVAEFSQSKFRPEYCEMKIGKDGDIPAVEFPFDKGQVSVIGSIDRLDTYGGYVRVVDYKTGTKKFKLPDTLFGLNLQMLIYLYAAVRGQGKPDSSAAGILYMPSKRDLDGNGMAMNGLLLSEKDVAAAMDRELKGEYIPKYSVTKSGALDSRCVSYVGKDSFTEIFDYIEHLMRDTGNRIISGDIAVSPTDGRETPACKYCDFKSVCHIENEPCKSVPKMDNNSVINKMKEVKQVES